MQINDSRRDRRYRQNVLRLTLSIVLFATTYLILLSFALAVFAFCIFTSVVIITSGSDNGSGQVMVGVIFINLMGGYFLYTVLKFLFQKKKHDTSAYILVSNRSEPQLFNLVEEIATTIGADFPERILFTLEPTAFVFYDADFRSLIFTPKKSLCIGISLLDSTSVTELSSIIAHELGHFSQKSMRFSAYFTVINTVSSAIFEEGSKFQANQYRRGDPVDIRKIGAVIGGIASVPMRIVFKLVNKNFLALSQEMEFHADELAAKAVAGDALASSLLRLDLASIAFSNALDHLKSQVQENRVSENIFPQIKLLLDLYGNEKNCEFREGIPQVTLPIHQGIIGTKLVLDAQWQSHPSISDRIKYLKAIPNSNLQPNDQPASSIIINLEKLQTIGTKRVYAIEDPTIISPITDAEFISFFEKDLNERAHDPIFNDYYMFRDPAISGLEISKDITLESNIELASLFSSEKVSLAIENSILLNDIAALEQFQNEEYGLKTFDYNGYRYQRKNWKKLHKKLIEQHKRDNELLNQNDAVIFFFFQRICQESSDPLAIENAFNAYFISIAENKKMNAAFQEFIRETDFISASDGLEDFDEREELEEKTKAFRKKIPSFKNMIEFVLGDSDYRYIASLDQKCTQAFSHFLNRRLSYWDGFGFDHEEVSVLSAAISAYYTTLTNAKKIFLKKLIDTLSEHYHKYNQN